MKRLFLVLFFIQLFLASSIFAGSIKINEFYAAGTTNADPDWVEFYVEGVDLSLYRIRDNTSTNKKDLSEAICNGNFCTIEWYNTLNNTGDTVKLVLISSPDSFLDEISYGGSNSLPPPLSGQSAGRNPDGNGNWTIFSTPSKGSSNNTSPTNTPSPTDSPTTQPTTAPTTPPTPTDIPVTFTVSSVPSSISSSQSFSVNIQLSGLDPNTKFYLKGAFIKDGLSGNQYFGKTKVGNNWIKNSQSWSDQQSITTDSSGSWNGNLEVMVDTEDSDFEGSGNYNFKAGRRSSENESVSWSEAKVITITGASKTPTPSPTSPKSTPTSKPIKSITPTPSKKFKETTPTAQVPDSLLAKSSSEESEPKVLGTSSQTKDEDQKGGLNPVMIIGGGILFIIGINLLVYFLKNR